MAKVRKVLKTQRKITTPRRRMPMVLRRGRTQIRIGCGCGRGFGISGSVLERVGGGGNNGTINSGGGELGESGGGGGETGIVR